MRPYNPHRIIPPPPVPALSLASSPLAEVDTDLLIVPIFEEDALTDVAGLEPATGGHLRGALEWSHDDRGGAEGELRRPARPTPVCADPHADPAFGPGRVKVPPAHAPNDCETGRRHNLPALTIMDELGVITAHGPFQGLDRFEARPAVVAALREQGRIVSEKRPYVHAVGHCSRCKTVVEPRLSLQWFVRVGPLAKAAGDAVRDGRVRIHPKEMEPRWFAWVDNMHDWCISRQLWWGHRIPVWYGPNGDVVCVGPDDELPSGDGWTQDEDVLDTWFSSALWPFSTLGWPEQTPAMEKFYPNQVLVTGYDILFFWVARMMMFGLYANADFGPERAIPFSTVALHGMVRDARGKKMSKSFGNVVDPMDWMDAYGSDPLRFTLARGANPGTDVPIGEDWVQASRNFCNKLWNATRFALLNGARVGELPETGALTAPDRWILSRLHATLAEVDELYEDFQFAKLTEAVYHFTWDEFCDWYVELAKTPLARGGADAERTRLALGHVLDALLRVLHPITPFVSEALWTTLTGHETLVTAAWPEPDSSRLDAAAEAAVADLQRLVTEVRRFRSDQGLKPGQRVPARLTGLAESLVGHEQEIRSLVRLDAPGAGFTPTASLSIGGVDVEFDLSGAIDVAAERVRLARAAEGAEKERDSLAARLSNPNFVERAKPEAGARGSDRDRVQAVDRAEEHGHVQRLAQLRREVPPTAARTPVDVDLLERHHVGVQRPDRGHLPVQVEPVVHAGSGMDVVRRHPQRHRQPVRRRFVRRSADRVQFPE